MLLKKILLCIFVPYKNKFVIISLLILPIEEYVKKIDLKGFKLCWNLSKIFCLGLLTLPLESVLAGKIILEILAPKIHYEKMCCNILYLVLYIIPSTSIEYIFNFLNGSGFGKFFKASILFINCLWTIWIFITSFRLVGLHFWSDN